MCHDWLAGATTVDLVAGSAEDHVAVLITQRRG